MPFIEKSIFEFKVTQNSYYQFLTCLPVLVGILPLVRLGELFPMYYVSVGIFLLLFLGDFIAQRFACGKIKITVDDKTMFFEWTKKIPFKNTTEMELLFKDITSFDFPGYYNRIANPSIAFFNNKHELIKITSGDSIFSFSKNNYTQFVSFIKEKSKALRNENLLQLK